MRKSVAFLNASGHNAIASGDNAIGSRSNAIASGDNAIGSRSNAIASGDNAIGFLLPFFNFRSYIFHLGDRTPNFGL